MLEFVDAESDIGVVDEMFAVENNGIGAALMDLSQQAPDVLTNAKALQVQRLWQDADIPEIESVSISCLSDRLLVDRNRGKVQNHVPSLICLLPAQYFYHLMETYDFWVARCLLTNDVRHRRRWPEDLSAEAARQTNCFHPRGRFDRA